MTSVKKNMVRSAGVEPATARFVAEYSIQLSYERIKGIIIAIFALKVKVN
jgi:hypothetical protein